MQLDCPSTHESILSAIALRERLLGLSNYLKGLPDKIDKKTALLRQEIVGQNPLYNLQSFGEQGMTLPHEPMIKVYGVDPTSCRIFKSAVQPMKLDFQARKFPEDWQPGNPLPELSRYSMILKNGDDTRQDQLVLTLFTLMDRMLTEVNLDFKFTCYKVLACTKNDGLMEFVPSETVQ